MPIDITDITLPTVAISGKSAQPKMSFVAIKETFSESYRGKISNRLILDLAAAFRAQSGKSGYLIRQSDIALGLFAEHCSKHGIRCLDHVSTEIIRDFYNQLKRDYPNKDYWHTLFEVLRACLRVPLTHIHQWPVIKQADLTVSTISGHSPDAFKDIMKALGVEIERIRGKIGRLSKDVQIGKVLNFEGLKKLLNASIGNTRLNYDQLSRISTHLEKVGIDKSFRTELAITFGVCEKTIYCIQKKLKAGKIINPHVGELPLEWADVIATIRHYLPDWPVVGRLSDKKNSWRVYAEPRGVLLGVFENKKDAEIFSEKHHGHIIGGNKIKLRSQMNPGEYLLSLSVIKTDLYQIARRLNKLGINATTLVERYFPTTYDWTCVLLFWFCLTGWNEETIRSVSVHDLSLVFKGQNPMELFNSNNIIISGHKFRSQGSKKGKLFRHISDVNDSSGLFRVLNDFYELTKPLRRYLKGADQNCILIGVPEKPMTVLPGLTMFGPSDHCAAPFHNGTAAVRKFFKIHEIYDNAERTTRIRTTNSLKLRKAYESMLEDMCLPLTIRRIFLGHESYEMTMTPYGASTASVAIRRKRLRRLLDDIDYLAFQGKLLRYQQTKKSQGNNIVQIFTHRDNRILVCWDRTNPTWHNHDKYLTKGFCDHFSECLFCKQCRVTEDSLPYLIKWRWDLTQWFKEVGFADFSLKMRQYVQAINEVFALCKNSDEWTSALKNAESLAMSPDFVAPPLWIGV